MHEIAMNGRALAVSSDGQDWRVAWHPPSDPPPGTPHGGGVRPDLPPHVRGSHIVTSGLHRVLLNGGSGATLLVGVRATDDVEDDDRLAFVVDPVPDPIGAATRRPTAGKRGT